MAVAVRCNQQFQVDQVGSKVSLHLLVGSQAQSDRLIVLVPAPFAEDWQQMEIQPHLVSGVVGRVVQSI